MALKMYTTSSSIFGHLHDHSIEHSNAARPFSGYEFGFIWIIPTWTGLQHKLRCGSKIVHFLYALCLC
jgi:hypothetical protein